MLQLRFGPWEVGFNTPSQVSKFKSISEGSVGDSFMPSKPHVPKFSPLGFMGLAHESCLECFNIYSINLLKFGFSFPSAGGAVLRKMMESLHPFDFS